MESYINTLIQNGENERVDFKKTITHLHKIARTFTAFANHQGGDVLIGVMDNGRIVGTNPDEERYMILSAIQNFIRPKLELRMHEVYMGGEGTILWVRIPKAMEIIESKTKKEEWKVYLREDDRCMMADYHQIKSLEVRLAQLRASQKALYTGNEEEVFNLLNDRNVISVKQYAKSIDASRDKALRILKRLVRQGELVEKQQYFALAS